MPSNPLSSPCSYVEVETTAGTCFGLPLRMVLVQLEQQPSMRRQWKRNFGDGRSGSSTRPEHVAVRKAEEKESSRICDVKVLMWIVGGPDRSAEM